MKRYVDNEILLPQVAQLIAGGHTVTLTVKGNSMNPFLRHGRDKVTLAPFSAGELAEGDVVLAREMQGGRIVLHRIIRRCGEELTLQGDGNVKQTEQSRTGLVMGLMNEAVRSGRHYPVKGKTWQRYSRWWMRLTPLRRLLLAVYRRLCLPCAGKQ